MRMIWSFGWDVSRTHKNEWTIEKESSGMIHGWGRAFWDYMIYDCLIRISYKYTREYSWLISESRKKAWTAGGGKEHIGYNGFYTLQACLILLLSI